MRFDQVKIVASDATSLAAFYEEVLECERLGDHDFSDPTLSRGLGATDAEIRMIWLRLPGGGDDGPILEIYQFLGTVHHSWAFGAGQGQLAFQVADVAATAERVLDAGGTYLGEIVDWEAPSGNQATFAFMRDPEGNAIDIWAPRQ